MSLDIDTVARTLSRLAISRTARGDHTKPQLTHHRYFSCGSQQAMTSTADTISRYIVGVSQSNGQEVERERAAEVLELLFNSERMDPGNFRTLLRIVEDLVIKLGTFRMDLAKILLDTLLAQSRGRCESEWANTTDPELHNPETLQSVSSLFADLYAMQFIDQTTYIGTLDRILPYVSGPSLTKILIFDFMSRALTNTAPKLPIAKWRLVRMRWVMAVKDDVGVDAKGRIRQCIDDFVADAEKGQVHSAVPFAEETNDEEMDNLCESIKNEVFALTCRAEFQARRAEKEREKLEAVGGVSLG